MKGELDRKFVKLLKSDYKFSKLSKDHQELDSKLKKIEKQKNLTPIELVETKKMKKRKLKMKDAMQKMMDFHI